MAGLKVDFTPLTQISSSAVNSNTIYFRDWQINNENLSAQITGVQLLFTTVNPFFSNSLCVYVDGIRQRPTSDYTITGINNFTFVGGSAPATGTDLYVDYRRSDL
jgi:hypothetical protein